MQRRNLVVENASPELMSSVAAILAPQMAAALYENAILSITSESRSMAYLRRRGFGAPAVKALGGDARRQALGMLYKRLDELAASPKGFAQ